MGGRKKGSVTTQQGWQCHRVRQAGMLLCQAPRLCRQLGAGGGARAEPCVPPQPHKAAKTLKPPYPLRLAQRGSAP